MKLKNKIDNVAVSVVIGNGESRKSIDFAFKKSIPFFGCNAIHRDLFVDVLVCVDHRMILESVEAVAANRTLIYVRPEWYHTFRKLKKFSNIRELPELPFALVHRADQPRNWGSGSYALLIAASISDTVYIIGFDLYSCSARINNVYKSTANYASASAPAIDPGYWIYQSNKIFVKYQLTSFVLVVDDNWQIPTEWKLPNVSMVSVSQFNNDSLRISDI